MGNKRLKGNLTHLFFYIDHLPDLLGKPLYFGGKQVGVVDEIDGDNFYITVSDDTYELFAKDILLSSMEIVKEEQND